MNEHDTQIFTEPREPAGDAATALPSGTRIGRLVVLEQIGEGGMGRVHTAYDPVLDRRVCLKFLKSMRGQTADSGQRARLIDEARLLARLSHPNILLIHDVGEFEHQVYLVTEFIDGWTLLDWVEESKPSPAAVIAAFRDAGSGLAAAHALDIVHRDFKPENVMMGRDGRVRVMDFGLASHGHQPVGTGAYGTPRYMPPEQRAGEIATAATDQYALCLSLAVCLGAQVDCGEISESVLLALPVMERQRRALRRGLLRDPAARFEDMASLLEALRPPARRGGWIGMTLGSIGALSIAGAVYLSQRAPDPCPLSAAPTAAWQPAQRAAMRDAFVATGLPYAADAFDRATPLIDRYLGDWGAQRQAACVATHVKHEQSAELLDRRMICLDSQLRQVDALGRLFAQPDTTLVDASMNAVLGLPGLETCADRDGLLSGAPLPKGAAAREAYESLDQALSVAGAERLAGRYAASRDALSSLTPQVMAFEHLPTRARFLALRGDAEMSLADHGAALRDYEDALFIAQAGGDRHLAASTTLDLAMLHARNGMPAENTQRWFERAELLADALDDPRIHGDYAFRHGQYLVLGQGRIPQGVASLKTALDTYVEQYGADSPRAGKVMNAYSWALGAAGRMDEALDYGRRALRLLERAYGVYHNEYLVSANNYAGLLNAADRSDEALELLASAYQAGVDNVGADHPNVLLVQLTWAGTLIGLERYAEALPKFQQQRVLLGRKFGPEHRLYGNAAAGEGVCLRELGQLDESETVMQDALDAGGPSYPPVERAQLSYELARTLARSSGNGARIRSLTSSAIQDAGEDHEWRDEIAAFASDWQAD